MADDSTNYYHYEPSVAAAAAFTVLFGITSLHHLYQLIRSSTKFMIPFLIGCFMEAFGFAIRAISTQSPESMGLYIVQSCFILIAPCFFAASIYMVFGYIVLVSNGEKHSLIRKRFLTKLFVAGDIFSILIQGNGAPLLTNDNANVQKVGKYIIVVGLVLQLISFGFFMIVSITFYKRILRQPTAQSSEIGGIPWRTHLFVLFMTSILIMIRSTFRVVEYVQGDEGYLLTHEAFMYAFDAALMICVVAVFNLKHPSEIRSTIAGKKAIGVFRTKTPGTFQPIAKDEQELVERCGVLEA